MADVLTTISRIMDAMLGRSLRSSEASKQALTVATGVPALGLDAMASTAYGPEAALAILAPLGVAGLAYMPAITLGILALLITLYLSYLQTAAAYPDGGGAYIVARENLGVRMGVIAGVSLMLDYVLNVAVGISAGVGAVVSAWPALHSHTLGICLAVLLALTLLNLRGVRETGVAFGAPLLAFLLCIGGAVALGLVRALLSGGHPHAIIAPPAMQPATQSASIALLLRAFASGCTAMTGVEAVSNGVPLFKKPAVPKARWTLTIIVAVLGCFLLALSFLTPAYGLHAMDERRPGYQTMLSQLVLAVAGRGPLYYISIVTIFFILATSAQTSFADFPRVCRLLAEDNFLPSFFANRGRRLVYSGGIIVLALLAGALLVAFRGVTDSLIPLFAVGAFGAFVLSQIGMVAHWHHEGGHPVKLAVNAIGATATSIALCIIIVAKFTDGAWIILFAGPLLVWAFWHIRHHYERLSGEIDRPIALNTGEPSAPIVVVPIDSWNCIAELALRFAMKISPEVFAFHVTTEKVDDAQLLQLWNEQVEQPAKRAGVPAPKLQIIQSPYRKVYEPILKFVRKIHKEHEGRLVAVVIPELVEPHWHEFLLHNLYGSILRALLLMEGDRQTIVIMTPWHLGK